MAKKGGAQQLQADINTDEEFEKFLDRPGLLVLDVYSEWCGPCLGMVGSLKKIKLELGGDNLQLAICKSDTISYLKRFNKKSEPTWLFVTRGRAVNLMFGTDVPKLMKLIASELSKLGTKDPRPTYAITELQPEEVKRRKVKEDAIAEAARIEFAAEEKKRRDYLTFVTDSIMENLSDMGVTIFGPQVNRDMFKKIVEPADALKLQCKDRKVVAVYKENFDIVNFACKNPLEEDVLEQLYEKELLMCFWKISDDPGSKVDKVMTAYAHALTTQRIEVDEFGVEEDHVIPPILTPMELKIEVELAEGEEYIEEEEAPPPEEERRSKQAADAPPGVDQPDDELGEEGGEEGEEGGGEGEEGEGEAGAGEEMPPPPLELDMGFELDGDDLDLEELEAEPEVVIEEPPKPRTRKKTIIIPPVWVPHDARTHAALIYVFFRSQTTPFLLPDPTPEPPCVIMAFDAYKKKDLINVAKRNQEDVPLFGFFTSDDPDEASFIANSESKYASQPHTASDKIVFKVSKKTSHTMLSLATYGPSYVSPNTVVGHEEALKFFPENYKTAEQELLEAKEQEAHQPQQKRRSKSKAQDGARKSDARKSDTSLGAPASAETETAAGEEGATTTSGEESGDSMPPTAEEGGAVPPAEADAAAESAAPPPEGEAPAQSGEPPAAETDAAAPPPPPEDSAPAAEEPAAAPPVAEEEPAAE